MTEVLGRREWVALPDLGIDRINAKPDTGARTSWLHFFGVRIDDAQGRKAIRCSIHPGQRRPVSAGGLFALPEDDCDFRDSAGLCKIRHVNATDIALGSPTHRSEFALNRRDSIGFGMFLGRTALKDRRLVDSGNLFRLRKRGQAGQQAR